MREVGLVAMLATSTFAITSETRRARQARTELLAQHCVVRSGCMRAGDNMVGSLTTEFPFLLPGVASNRQTCQEACAKKDGCNFFTWYDRDGAFPYSCYLYSTCDQEEEDCQHCYSGPGECKQRSLGNNSKCPAIQEGFGGSWYCFPDTRIGQPVAAGTKCIWQCPGQSSYHQCDAGVWSDPPGTTRCMCHNIGLEHEGEVVCHPPVTMTEAVSSGTYCLHTCHGHPKAEMMCEHSLWSLHPSQLSCEASNHTTGRNGGRNLPAAANLDLGVRAGQKLREMERREEEEEVKTKIDGQILTMKKVTDGVFGQSQGFGSSFDRPQGSGSDIPLIDEELLQRLEAVLNSAEDSFAPSQPLPSAQPLTSSTLSPLTPSLNNFLPPLSTGSSQPEFRIIPQDQETGAVFPQQVEIITGAPHQGFHHIRAPDLLAPGSEHLVASQLNFGSNEKARMAGHVAQLEELENLLESTDSLSPLTLEMVESALVGLKEKRAEHLNRKESQARNRNTVAERDIKNFFPHPEQIMVKGNAPLLVPHPGDNMVPMTDAAIDKQNKLRGLRHEMILMKSKISELEKKGINPTREHVKTHLNNIKSFSLHERPLERAPVRAVAPVQPIIFSVPKPNPLLRSPQPQHQPPPTLNKSPQILSKPVQLRKSAAPDVVVGRRPPQGVIQRRRPEKKGAKLVVVKVPAKKVAAPTKDSTMAELQDDIGDVLEGLTELAERFPEDFSSLMEAFEGGTGEKVKPVVRHVAARQPNVHPAKQKKHMPMTRNIKPSEIRNLANIIAEEEERQKMEKVKKGLFKKDQFNDLGVCQKPPSPPHGQVLCNRAVLGVGALCLLQCHHGWIPEAAELTTCRKNGRWSETRLACVRPVALLVGGYNVDEDLLADVEVYSPDGRCGGVKVADLPSPRRGLVAAWVGGKVLACGGVNNTQQLNLCWQYNPNINTWTETSGTHSERHFGSIVSASGSLVVLGGRDGTAQPMARGDMEQFQVEDWSWAPVKTKMTLERSYQCSVGLSRELLVVTGGYSWNSILARTEALNMTAEEGNRWRRLAPLLKPRYLHACSPVHLGTEVGVLVAGGYSSSYLNSTEVYRYVVHQSNPQQVSYVHQQGKSFRLCFRPSADRWETGGPMAVPRQGASILVLEGKPTVLGGFHDYDKYPTATEQYDENLGFWFPLRRPLKKGRRYFGAVAVPETLFPGCR